MAINKLYISNEKYKFDSQQSQLLDCKNYQTVIDSDQQIDCHTSISDLTITNMPAVIKNAKEIIVIDIDFTDFTYDSGRLLNVFLNANAKISFIDSETVSAYKIAGLSQTRQTDKPVLWMAGCSLTFGAGVAEDQRYGKILSNLLNLPEVLLAKGGSSIFYSADQILRSDVRSGDVVVWGLTSIPRVEVYNRVEHKPVTISNYLLLDKSLQYWNLDYFSSPTQSLIAIRMILQVINFCKKVGAKLYLVNLLDTTWIPVVFSEYSNFINFVDDTNSKGKPTFIDYGGDDEHPGPMQHQQYAEKIFSLIERGDNYGKTI